MKFSLIAAVSKNGVIGCRETNSMPWKRIPVDMKRFKNLTKKSGVVVMGRLTFESIGKPLPDRKNIVLTRRKDFHISGVHIADSLKRALLLANEFKPKTEELMIIGGESLFKFALLSGLASTVYLTRIQEEFKGDVFFPKMPQWYEKIKSETECWVKGENTPYNLLFEKYEHKH